MNISLPLLSAAAGVLLACIVAAGAHGWWQHIQLSKLRTELSEARTALVLCETDKATLAASLEEQNAAIEAWETWGERVRKSNAEALAEADKRRQALEELLRAAQMEPAGDCEAEAEELLRWYDSVRL